jgi:hypothetical protein
MLKSASIAVPMSTLGEPRGARAARGDRSARSRRGVDRGGRGRLALAKRYLADPTLSLTDTAFLLGYSDLSAFSRAYRRWTGKSPQMARRA